MRIAILGYGGVGKAFLKLILEKKKELMELGCNIQINYILNSKGGIYNSNGIDCYDVIEFSKKERDIIYYPHGGSSEFSFHTILMNKDIDVLIELTPTNKETGKPGMTHIRKALENGIHVITGNKGPIFLAYDELNTLAIKNNVQLAVGCTTGGALPAINAGLFDMAGSQILSIEGILNGTTNFILSEMENNNYTYQEALILAQDLGIAETDPSLDVLGWDTASKLLILTNILFKQKKSLNDISVSGITDITLEDIKQAKMENKKYKLVGKTTLVNNKIVMSVDLKKIDSNHSLYNVDGKNKAVKYTSDTLGDLTIIGGASNQESAAASILRDLINILKGYNFSSN